MPEPEQMMNRQIMGRPIERESSSWQDATEVYWFGLFKTYNGRTVWDPFHTIRFYDKAHHAAQQEWKLARAEAKHRVKQQTTPAYQMLHTNRERVRGYRGWLRKRGGVIIPLVSKCVMMNAWLQVLVGTILLVFSFVLAVENRQWRFTRHLSDIPAQWRTAILVTIVSSLPMLGVIHCFVLRTRSGSATDFHHGHLRKSLDKRADVAAEVTHTQPSSEERGDRCKVERRFIVKTLVFCQFFGALVVAVVKVLFRVLEGNFSGELTSDVEKGLALYILLVLVLWLLCVMLQSCCDPLAQPEPEPSADAANDDAANVGTQRQLEASAEAACVAKLRDEAIAAGRADEAMKIGTRLYVEGRGRGTYRRFEPKWIQRSNIHWIKYDNITAQVPERLRWKKWRLEPGGEPNRP